MSHLKMVLRSRINFHIVSNVERRNLRHFIMSFQLIVIIHIFLKFYEFREHQTYRNMCLIFVDLPAIWNQI